MAPDWAIEQALKVGNDAGGIVFSPEQVKRGDTDRGYQAVILRLADYIAQHEKPPVDPLLLHARGITVLIGKERGYTSPWATDCLNGTNDQHEYVIGALAGLKRGMELAK